MNWLSLGIILYVVLAVAGPVLKKLREGMPEEKSRPVRPGWSVPGAPPPRPVFSPPLSAPVRPAEPPHQESEPPVVTTVSQLSPQGSAREEGEEPSFPGGPFPAAPALKPASALTASLRRTWQSPEGLATAFIVGEILGPPLARRRGKRIW